MRAILACVCVLVPLVAAAQDANTPDPLTDPLTPTPTATTYPLYPPGMRVVTGAQGAMPRLQPSINAMCGEPAHTCTQADVVLPNTYGVIGTQAPVRDTAGWYWNYIVFASGREGWTTAYPPYINALSPPQMVVGSSFQVVGDYLGPVLTAARCISDGVTSDGVLNLQPDAAGQRGTLHCPWTKPPLGNHIAVLQAVNTQGTSLSTELQFSITNAPAPPIPQAPTNLRIEASQGVAIQTAPLNPKDFKPIEQPKLP
jgi:hypothetical protein